jgi:hypothetical protein
MTTEQVFCTITEIDNQLVHLVTKKASIDMLRSIVDLRNKIILKYQPCSDLDWTIRNKKVLAFLKKENWGVQWVLPDSPINCMDGVLD